MSITEGIMDKIQMEPYSGCWFWEGPLNNGHPRFNDRGRSYVRPLLRSLNGFPETDGRTFKSCGNTECLNPRHDFRRGGDLWKRMLKQSIRVGECLEFRPDRKDRNHRLVTDEKGKQLGAHVVSYLFNNGPIERGLVVRHTCDNPVCIEPEHLILGTPKDNSQDSVDRDRQARGERNAAAKLTDGDVLGIFNLHQTGRSIKSLAVEYRVSSFAIGRIVHKRGWRHLWR